MGICRASRKYKPDSGKPFSNYASWWAAVYIQRALQKQERTIKVPTKWRTPLQDTLSLDKPPRIQVEDPWNTLDEIVDSDHLRACVERLKPRFREIVVARFGLDGKGERELRGKLEKKIGVCYERVRQLEKQALRRLREMLLGE